MNHETKEQHNPFSTPLARALEKDVSRLNGKTLIDLEDDALSLRLEVGDIYADYSNHIIDDATFNRLIGLCNQQGLRSAIDNLFAGDNVNFTEERAALHGALRGSATHAALESEVQNTLKRCYRLSSDIRNNIWRGAGGDAITDIVHIGIGGSELGPKFIIEALQDFAGRTSEESKNTPLRIHFVSNVDGYELNNVLQKINPQSSLFIIASKSFNTQETLLNAKAAKAWLLSAYENNNAVIANHFIAISANIEKAHLFGIPEDNVFPMWDWVGGRYSIWSAVGLPAIIALGKNHFDSFLQGAKLMDTHFQCADFSKNLPIILAVLGIWYINFKGSQTHAFIPYNQPLNKLSFYLQQLEMESNGKSVNKWNEPIEYSTVPVIWGGTGINGQHAYYQMLYQGTNLVPIDFILAGQTSYTETLQHSTLIANYLAHSDVLAHGFDKENNNPHKRVLGNRPFTTILLKKLNPAALGQLIALYEHKVFVQSIIWNINAFDQWGVEGGKKGAKHWEEFFSENNSEKPAISESANLLLAQIRKNSDLGSN